MNAGLAPRRRLLRKWKQLLTQPRGFASSDQCHIRLGPADLALSCHNHAPLTPSSLSPTQRWGRRSTGLGVQFLEELLTSATTSHWS